MSVKNSGLRVLTTVSVVTTFDELVKYNLTVYAHVGCGSDPGILNGAEDLIFHGPNGLREKVTTI